MDSGRGGKREGAGRKALGAEKAVCFSISLPPDLRARVDAIADAKGKSRSSVIVGLIRKALG